MSGVVVPLFHGGVFTAYMTGLYYDVKPPRTSEFATIFYGYGNRLKFLTFLDMLLQFGYFGLAILNDIAGSSEQQPTKQTRLQKARDWVFTSLAFPLGTFVTFIFWSIYTVDRELILPAGMDPWFPQWLNHVMHSLPMVSCLMEQIMVFHTHQRGHLRILPIFCVYLFYLIWLVFIKYHAGFWVYPVFDALDTGSRAIFLIILCVPALFFYVLGERLHVAVWGLESALKAAKKSKHH